MENKKVLIYSKCSPIDVTGYWQKVPTHSPQDSFFLLYRLTVVMCLVFSYVWFFCAESSVTKSLRKRQEVIKHSIL